MSGERIASREILPVGKILASYHILQSHTCSWVLLCVGGCLLLSCPMSPVCLLLLAPGCHRRRLPPTFDAFLWNGHRLGPMLFRWLRLRFGSVRTQTTFWQVSHISALLIVSKQDSKRSVGQ